MRVLLLLRSEFLSAEDGVGVPVILFLWRKFAILLLKKKQETKVTNNVVKGSLFLTGEISPNREIKN
jgi:hypothetical protein